LLIFLSDFSDLVPESFTTFMPYIVQRYFYLFGLYSAIIVI